MDDTQRKTRSQRKAEMADAIGFNIISTVQLDRVEEKENNKTASLVKPIERRTAQVAKRVEKTGAKKDTVAKRVEKKVAKKAQVAKHVKKVESEKERLERKVEEARRELLAISPDNKSRIQELERNAMTEAEVRDPEAAFADAFAAFKDGRKTLSWQDSAALGGQVLTKNHLSLEQLKKVNANYRYQPFKSNGRYRGFQEKDRSLVAAVQYQDGNSNLNAHNEVRAIDLNPRIQEMCAEFHKLCGLHPNKGGFDIFSQYNTGISLDRVKNLLAVYCRRKDFREFSTNLSDTGTAGIHGMEVFRILEDGAIVKLKGGAAAMNPNAGYRFVFKKGNKTKFD